jgi:putative Holliday junction resolvase
MRYLAIDYGSGRTGLAVCDPTETLVSPLAVIRGQKTLVAKISQLVATEAVEAVVLGLPLNMDGSEGPQAKAVFRFAERLKATLDIPVYFQDERLSSFAAEQRFSSAELTKAERKKPLDAVAAAEILEAFLEQKKAR